MRAVFLPVLCLLALLSPLSSHAGHKENRGRERCTYEQETIETRVLGELTGTYKSGRLRINGKLAKTPDDTDLVSYLVELAEDGCEFPRHYRCNAEDVLGSNISVGTKVVFNGQTVAFLSTYDRESLFYGRERQARELGNWIVDEMVEAGVCTR